MRALDLASAALIVALVVALLVLPPEREEAPARETEPPCVLPAQGDEPAREAGVVIAAEEYAFSMPAQVARAIENEPAGDERVAMVAAFMSGWSGVLVGEAGVMVAAADRHGLDWRLLPVIAVLESQAGREACGYNPFGYASCAVTFGSWAEAVERAAATLASYGAGIDWQLCVWNQGHGGCGAGLADGYVASGLGLVSDLGGSAHSGDALAAGAFPAGEEVGAND